MNPVEPASLLSLSWEQVDPRRNAFDPTGAPDSLRPLVEHLLEEPDVDQRRKRFVSAVTEELIRAHGAWAVGWSFSMGEGSFGGVVRTWCCSSHSIAPDATPSALVDLVLSSLREWREHLSGLADHFASLRPMALKDQAGLAEAIGSVLTRVMKATECEDAWYGYAELATGWFLQSLGAPVDRSERIAREALEGRFESWVEPAPDTTARVSREAALKAGPALNI